jgi:Flp pilus assembly protein TadG
VKAFREKILKQKKSERGSGEVITALIMLPLVIWLIFSLIDVSLYFTARSNVQNVTRDAARQVAVWGGNASRLNPSNQAVDKAAYNLLYVNGKCTASSCTKPPVVKCTPQVTTVAGQTVACSTTYHYSAANKNNPISGFASILNRSFTITETARSETGFR